MQIFNINQKICYRKNYSKRIIKFNNGKKLSKNMKTMKYSRDYL